MLHIVAFTVNLCVHRKPSKHDIVDQYTTTSHHIKKNPNLCHVYNGRAMFVDSVYSDVQSLMMHATWRSSRQLFIPRIHQARGSFQPCHLKGLLHFLNPNLPLREGTCPGLDGCCCSCCMGNSLRHPSLKYNIIWLSSWHTQKTGIYYYHVVCTLTYHLDCPRRVTFGLLKDKKCNGRWMNMYAMKLYSTLHIRIWPMQLYTRVHSCTVNTRSPCIR